MNVEDLRNYCLSLPEVRENRPWTEPQYEMLITFTVGDKWFCLFNPEEKFVDVKCNPEVTVEMQSRYEGAFPAWHMNKEHWLGVRLESDVPDEQIRALIDAGYKLVVAGLSKKRKEESGL